MLCSALPTAPTEPTACCASLPRLPASLAGGSAARPGNEVGGFPTGEIGPQGHVPGHRGDPSVQFDGVVPGIESKDRQQARIRAGQPQRDPDRRGLAGSVGTKEAVELA